MFGCVNCGHKENVFHVEVAKIDQGVYLYRAKCPKCGDWKVNVLPGIKEEQLRICAFGIPGER